MLQGSCANVYISTEVASHENCYFNTVSELETFVVHNNFSFHSESKNLLNGREKIIERTNDPSYI